MSRFTEIFIVRGQIRVSWIEKMGVTESSGPRGKLVEAFYSKSLADRQIFISKWISSNELLTETL